MKATNNVIRFDPLIRVEDDGLFIPEVRQWSLEKYKLVGSYCDIFTTGMKNKWSQLAYIDLFAGAGYARIKETKSIYRSSALIAMSLPTPFTKYILCEQDEERFNSLEQRVKRDFSHLNTTLILGDSNENIQDIINAIPEFGKGNTLLPFCFVDPYSLNLNFETIRRLGVISWISLYFRHFIWMQTETLINIFERRIRELPTIWDWKIGGMYSNRMDAQTERILLSFLLINTRINGKAYV